MTQGGTFILINEIINMANYTEGELDEFARIATDYMHQQQLIRELELITGMGLLFFIFIILLIYSLKKQALPSRMDKILVGFFFIVVPIIGGIIYLIFKILTRKKVTPE